MTMPREANAWLGQISPHLNFLWRGHWRNGTNEPGRYLYDHELVVVTRGACRVRVKTASYKLTAGTFLIIPPGTLHATTTLPGGVHRTCLHFDWIRCRPPRRRLALWVYHPGQIRRAQVKLRPSFVPDRIGRGRFDPAGPVPALLETLFRRAGTGSPFDLALCSALVLELLIHLLWKKSSAQRSRDRATTLAYAVKELLDKPATVAVAGIQPLLAGLGFSYEHLCRLFRAKFGVSPVRYLNAVRLERAHYLLRDPKRTIAEVAYAAGFNDPAYFSRKFRQRHGVAPSRAREF